MKAFVSLTAVLWSFALVLPALADETETKAAPAAQQEPQAAEETPAAEEVTDQILFNQIRMLYATGKIDEAEEKFEAALEQFPDSDRLQALHGIAHTMLSRANRPDEAYNHLEAYTDFTMEQAASVANISSFSNALSRLVDAARTQGGEERAMEVIESYAERADKAGGAVDATDALRSAVHTQKAILLGKSGKADEGRAILNEQVAAATAALEADEGSVDAIIQMTDALMNRLALETAVEGGNSQAAWSEYSDFLEKQARAHADNNQVTFRFLMEHFQRASLLARSAPDDAEAALKRIADFRANEGAEVEIHSSITSRLERLEKTIADTRRREALIGAAALYPENIDAWVNGEARTPESLQGKVVLLDFFAVWCGPCIATFPHLRQWNDDYASQGLEIVGVSSYYKYDWDDETKRPKRGEGEVTPEQEQAAMEKFVAHHELRHPIAYVTDSELKEHYVVSGIPHVVVIDRQGKVRLFKIGSGDANAHAVEEAIKECLAE